MRPVSIGLKIKTHRYRLVIPLCASSSVRNFARLVFNSAILALSFPASSNALEARYLYAGEPLCLYAVIKV
jgi:hypothetical protein